MVKGIDLKCICAEIVFEAKGINKTDQGEWKGRDEKKKGEEGREEGKQEHPR